MRRRYTAPMPARQSLPFLWLLSDARNDAALETALRALPPGSGFVFRHHHLEPEARRERFDSLAVYARASNDRIVLILAGSADDARDWGAQGTYGNPARQSAADGLLRLATAHCGAELKAAEQSGADGVFLSPVFATRSHHLAQPLGIHGFHVLAQQSAVPVIALGGMTKARAAELNWPRWGAIDGLVSPTAR